MKNYAIGLDLGGTNSVMGIVSKDGRLVSETTVKTWAYGYDLDAYVNACAQALAPLIEAVGLENIAGMGIGAPNANYYTGCIEHAPNLPWKGASVPLAETFSKALGLPVTITNDANAAAMGEMTYGAARGMKNFIMITLGTGVGSGIVVDGRVVYGSDGMAGELGHTTIDYSMFARRCGCGRYGCLETHCSAPGIVYTAQEIMKERSDDSLLRKVPAEELECKHVGLAAAQRDAIAQETLRRAGSYLGRALANFACINSPEAFVLFGGVVNAGELLLLHVREAYEDSILECYRGKTKILVSELDGAKAAVLGASALAF